MVHITKALPPSATFTRLNVLFGCLRPKVLNLEQSMRLFIFRRINERVEATFNQRKRNASFFLLPLRLGAGLFSE